MINIVIAVVVLNYSDMMNGNAVKRENQFYFTDSDTTKSCTYRVRPKSRPLNFFTVFSATI